MNSTLRKIIFLLGDDRKKIPILLTMFVFSSIGDLIGIALIGPYVSLIIEGGSDLYAIVAITEFFNIYEGDVVIYLGLALVGVFFVKSVVLILVNRYIFNFSSNRQASLRAYLLKSYQNMPYETFLSKNSSEYIHTIQQLTQEYVNTLRYALRSASDGVVVILIFLIIAWKSPLTVLGIILTIVVLIFTYDILFKSKQNQYGLVVNSAMRQIIKSVNESISGFKEIRILGKEEYFYQIVSKSSFTYSKNHSKSLLINSSPRYLLELLVVVFIVTFVSLASGRNEGATEIVSMLAIFGVAAMRVLPAASIISSFIGLLRYNKDGIDKLHNAYSMSKSYTSLNKSDKFKKDAFAIVDEVDSILIDEARTPLVISAESNSSIDLFPKINKIKVNHKYVYNHIKFSLCFP